LIISKWDFEKHEYEQVENPYASTITFDADDDQEEIQCANCGKRILRGESMVSKQWHDNIGFGYPVCEECHIAEWDKWNSEKERNKAHA